MTTRQKRPSSSRPVSHCMRWTPPDQPGRWSCCMIVQMSRAKRLGQTRTHQPPRVWIAAQARPGRGRTAKARGHSCCARCRQTRCRHSTPTWRNDGGLEARSRAAWNAWPVCVCVDGVCHGCAAEPQRRQKESGEPTGRRARANWRAHREEWEVRKRGRCSRNPQPPGAREQGPASRSGCERGKCAPAETGGQHLTAGPVGEPPSLN